MWLSQVVVWRLLQDQLPLSVDLQWALSCLCLALQQPCVWNKLSTAENTTHTCSLIYCLRLIIVAGNEDSRMCLYSPSGLVLSHAMTASRLNILCHLIVDQTFFWSSQWLRVLVTSCCIQRRERRRWKETLKETKWTPHMPKVSILFNANLVLMFMHVCFFFCFFWCSE